MKKSLQPLQFQKKILRWFDQHGRKHLPWQEDKTPYRVWLSEIMLQQTQVQTVIPYFNRFIEHFPDVISLGQATEDEVLALWAGLGYYSRARHLHKAAKQIVKIGQFPNQLDDLCQLPGIGRSTAGAIMALAFNQRATILDGNVKRVLVRLHNIMAPVNETKTEKYLWTLATQLTPSTRIADYTQAMMDLGALICTRTHPKCTICPLQKDCGAYHANTVADLPIKIKKAPIPVRSATFLVLKNNNSIYLHKRPSPGIWGGLWCLPEFANKPCQQTIRTFCAEHFSITTKRLLKLPPFRHTFTHFHLDIHPIIIALPKSVESKIKKIGMWYDLKTILTKGIPKPIRLILEQLERGQVAT